MLSSEVVEKLAVQLTVLDTELEVLETTERSQELSTELVGPVSEESKLSSSLEAASSLGSVGDLLCKGLWRSSAGWVTGSVAVQEEHLCNLAAGWDQRVGIRKTVVGG